jgi:RNA polymerase sigma-70 factor, ECF subfamily
MQALADRIQEKATAMVDLLGEAQRGEVAAFEALYRRHVGRVHGLCRRLARDAVRAEELTQEVFLRAWKHLGACGADRPFEAWLCRIAIHVVLADNRSFRRRFRREAVTENGILPEVGVAAVPAGLALDLDRAIEKLPPGARQVFVLHDVEGFRHEEIGKFLGLSAGTSKGQLHRARKLLREALGS